MDVAGYKNGVSLSEGAQCGGLLGKAPLMGISKDMLWFLFLGARGC
jgi:hypothetical protein